jgi:2-phosphoglycerate kinase
MKKQLDGRLLWLDEGQLHAGKFLSQMLHTETKRTLTRAEEQFKQLSAAYCYLYEKAKQHGVLDEEDTDYLFENETIH